MKIRRINGYDDPRFPRDVLHQHGAFVTEDGTPCIVRITGLHTAMVECPEAALDALVEEFRFFAEHITVLTDTQGNVLREFSEVPLFRVRLDDFQPSQFFVDEDKLAAVSTFVHAPEDVVIPVLTDGDRYIACDGHTRLYAAHRLGFTKVPAFICDPFDDILDFVRMARERGVHRVADMKLLTHEEYAIRWDDFCNRYFEART